jgi:hypothetical protein
LQNLKRTLGRPKRRWEYNIKVDFRETGDWIHMAQGMDRVVGSCEDGYETSGFIKGREFD